MVTGRQRGRINERRRVSKRRRNGHVTYKRDKTIAVGQREKNRQELIVTNEGRPEFRLFYRHILLHIPPPSPSRGWIKIVCGAINRWGIPGVLGIARQLSTRGIL